MTPSALRRDVRGRIRARLLPLAMLSLALLLAGCGRDNGLPQDLTEHLRARHIEIETVRSHAPTSGRGGYLVARHDPAVVAALVSAFALERVPVDDARWVATASNDGITVPITELWGSTGRPATFKLKDGGQFEYFYLLVTKGGEMYLVAEYAYG